MACAPKPLKPCPYCRWDARLGTHCKAVSIGGPWQIKCEHCGARGSCQKTEAAAVRVWNDVFAAFDAGAESVPTDTDGEFNPRDVAILGGDPSL